MMQTLGLLHDEGNEFVVSVARHKIGTKDIWDNRTFTSFEDAEKHITKETGKGKSAFIKFAQFDGHRKPNGRPEVTVEHVVGSRNFVIDMDGGQGKPYTDADHALAEFNRALSELQSDGLPAPNLVLKTGHGIHVAWSIDEVFPRGEWEQGVFVLYHAFTQAGLVLDPGMKSSNFGVRVCGEHILNCKVVGQPAPTAVLTVGQRISAPAWRAWIAPRSKNITLMPAVSKPKVGGVNAEYMIPVDHLPFSLMEITPECGVLKSALSSNGNGYDHPAWMLLIAQAAKDDDKERGRQFAHSFSLGDPRYDETEVDEKFDDFVKAGRGVVSCQKMHDACKVNSTACEACPHWGKIKSVAELPGKLRKVSLIAAAPAKASFAPIAAAPVANLAGVGKLLPDPSYVNTTLGLQHITHEEKWEMVLPGYHLWDVVVHEVRGGAAQTLMSFTMSTAGGQGQRTMSLDFNSLKDTNAVCAAFAKLGYPHNKYEGQRMFGAVTSFVQQMRERREVHYINRSLGWSDDASEFSLGDATASAAGIQLLTPTEDRKNFGVHGDATEALRLLHVIMANELRPEAHALLVTSFAAPLLNLTGVAGILNNFYSTKSGLGKSTLVRAAASVWGKPLEFLATVDDTQNAVVTRLTKLKHLPLYLDEMRMDDPAAYMRKLLFRLAGGQDKRRLKSDSTEQVVDYWETMAIGATNFALSGIVNTGKVHGDAVSARFTDYEMPGLPQGSAAMAGTIQQATKELEQHNGYAGRMFAEFIVLHRDQIKRDLKMMVDNYMPRSGVYSGDMGGRIQVASMACLILAAQIVASQKIAPIDPALVGRAGLTALMNAKTDRRRGQDRVTTEDIIGEFFKMFENSRLLLVRTPDGSTGPRYEHPPVHKGVAYEINIDDCTSTIDVRVFEQFLADNGHNAVEIRRDMHARKYHRNPAGTIGKGTSFVTSARETVLIPLKGSAWADMAESLKRKAT